MVFNIFRFNVIKLFFSTMIGICIISAAGSLSAMEANTYLAHAKAACKKGEYKAALKDLDTYLKQGSLNTVELKEGHFLSGVCLEKMGKYIEAKYHFRKAIENGYIYVSRLYDSRILQSAVHQEFVYSSAFDKYRHAHYKGAAKLLTDLLAGELYAADRRDALFLFGRVQFQLGNQVDAHKYFAEVLKIDRRFKPNPAKVKSEELALFNRTRQEYEKKHGRASGKSKHGRWIIAGVAGAAAAAIGIVLALE